ncbi:CPCC family cysteine-rich protein [Pseudothauera hydrothermalis]|uniref:CPCC family cysteine-rich protein n=1 Tax=Pseudothauera hydrothermalis TaxID=2184083 RepID=UPI000E091FE1|nr:CPCC family cysteine-rich protein [Pseudothauera hydrothermalis]
MSCARLDFTQPDGLATGEAVALASSPAFSLSPPEAGWIRLAIEHPDADFPPVMMSKVFSPLAPLWAWSLAVAWGMEPASCRIDEEGSAVYLIAKAGTEGRLSFTLARTQYGCRNEPERLLQALTREEERAQFLHRWSALWAAYFGDETLPWIEWERREETSIPEPMRDMPWERLPNLATFATVKPAPWPREALIAWFWLLLAHHLRSRRHGCEYAQDPARYILREMAFARHVLDALAAARQALGLETSDNDKSCRALIQRAQDIALYGPDEAEEPDDEFAGFSSKPLVRAYYRAQQAMYALQAETVRALLSRLPIGEGSAFIDEQGRRARLVHQDGRRWVLYWEDGRLSEGDAFYAGQNTACRWPVAEGPVFDEAALNAIDRRRLAFMRLGVSPLCVVCPCCGYPCMEEEELEADVCDICRWPIGSMLSRLPPPLDAETDEEGDPISPTLRQCRQNFLDHLDADPPEGREDDWAREYWRSPQRQAFARQAMAEWDVWLRNPDLEHTPEPVWVRMSRWREKNR